MSFRFKDSKR